jgi:hypothetical protein
MQRLSAEERSDDLEEHRERVDPPTLGLAGGPDRHLGGQRDEHDKPPWADAELDEAAVHHNAGRRSG